MQKQLLLSLSPKDAASEEAILSKIVEALSSSTDTVTGYTIIKKSIDARSKNICIHISLIAYINEITPKKSTHFYQFNAIRRPQKTVIIIGAGPAGIFAALRCIELGFKPVLLERGKDVKSRRRDLAVLNKEGIINPESNYCFGEGGAGTYSDGKLYTRSSKRGNIKRILELFVQFGADEKILYESHPHIGTNKLPQIITSMRQCIIDCGGEFHFNQKLVDFTIEKDIIKNVITANGSVFVGDVYILATGHSARDVYELLYNKKILLEEKPFALGVRIEHPQSIIDTIQYKCDSRGEYLPPASYSLVNQVEGKGVFSFCMCPGGIIAPASTAQNELVVNGWSPSKRNNPYANSGIVVELNNNDILPLQNYHSSLQKNQIENNPLALLNIQKAVEQTAYLAGGGNFVAPAQRLVDFTKNITSNHLPSSSYLPGLKASNLHQVLPSLISRRLAQGFLAFGKKMKGYYTNEAIVVATESRTSSPVKIPRDPISLQHLQIKNLYPCGEGAGYAGGIVSAAMDGEKCVAAIYNSAL